MTLPRTKSKVLHLGKPKLCTFIYILLAWLDGTKAEKIAL